MFRAGLDPLDFRVSGFDFWICRGCALSEGVYGDQEQVGGLEKRG